MKLKEILNRAKFTAKNVFKNPNYTDAYGVQHIITFNEEGLTEILYKDGKVVQKNNFGH